MASMVEGNVHIPGIGEMSKKKAAGAVIIAAGIVGIAYYRHSKNAAAATANTTDSSTAATDASSAIDPSTGVPYADEYAGGIDPNTGEPYALEGYGGYDPFSGVTGTTVTTSTSGYSTNADWATAAESELAAMGVNPTAAATAISRVLAGLPVTTQQQDLFLEAVGLLQAPPNGYPQPIKLTDTPGQPGATKVRVPNVVGVDVEQATQILTAEGLKPKGPKGVPHEIHTVTSTSPRANAMVNSGTTVTLHYKTVHEADGHKSGGGGVIHK